MNHSSSIEEMDNKDLARLVVDFFHRIVLHYALWFNEVWHQMGREGVLEALDAAFERSLSIQMARLSKILGFPVQEGIPQALLDMPRERLLSLLDGVAANWLANDGVWFQAIEFRHGMNDAKRCNDSCWGRFSPVEAWAIKRLLHLPEHPGLDGLQQALGLRVYARINVQSFVRENADSLVFQMNDCRVQSARKRKGLDDYPCKSGGLVEYTSFAKAIDSRIRTECVGCPPDVHPEEWYCAWRFTISEEEPHR
uniref:Cytosolic protein n=1 Tax=Desulfatirhabdium butyrativorans TaxID=340467 RepID=A0A7C4MLP4_9BACT